MLPGLGFNEILVLGILALVVVGPKDLPLLLRKFGRWTAKLRGMAQEFRTGFDELARQAELDELKREVEALRKTTSLQDIGRELSKPLPTLEDYAGVKSPPAMPASAPKPPEEPSEPAAEHADADAGAAAEPDRVRAEPPLDEPVALDAPEPADAAPIRRSGP